MSLEAMLIAFEKYRDQYGLVQPGPYIEGQRVGTSHNGIRFTVEAVYALWKARMLSDELKWSYLNAILDCQVAEGLFGRDPTNQHLEGPDDYHALAFLAKLLDPILAQRILGYGKDTSPRYLYNNLKPREFNFSAWLGRQQQVIAMLESAAGYRVGTFRMLWATATLGLSFFKPRDDQDDKVLTWFLIKCLRGHRWYFDSLADAWVRRFKLSYKGGIGEVLAEYFQNGDHPSAIYLQGEYGE